jgi:Ca2+-binding RTX toxin-like protein
LGGLGNDTYMLDNTSDLTIETANEGTDTVSSSVSYSLGDNIENLTLTGATAIDGVGNASDNVLTGNAVANVLAGGAGNDTLNGGAGADSLVGGLGNDTYQVDNVGDVVTENAGEGTDTVNSAITYVLGANIENLTLTGTAAINATGNALDNVLIGNSGSNVLDGGAGSDTMIGGLGNDTFVVDNVGDLVTENVSAGTDTVSSSISYTLSDNLENLILTGALAINGAGNASNNVLTGNAAINVLTGGAGNDTLNGGAGADTLVGGLGNDIYMVDNASDLITEDVNEGIDQVNSSITYALSANVENLTLTGTAAISGTGNATDNVLTGNSAANTLIGGAGNDTLNGGSGADIMVGGDGNDIFFVNASGDIVAENTSEGTDTINSSISYVLGTNVENLVLTGTTAINGTGNASDNLLTGNSAANSLTGSAGNDTLDGGLGNDALNGGDGSDTYLFARTGGQDVVNNNDTNAASLDVLKLDSTVDYDQLWFQHVGNNLVMTIIGTTDKVTFTNWYTNAANQIDEIQTASGDVLTTSEIETLVSAMASFSPPAQGQISLDASYSALTPVLVANWTN